MVRPVFLFAILVNASTPSFGGEPHVIPKGTTVTARCVSVHDGDTLTLLMDGRTQARVRLDGIDAPELGQPFSRRSRESLSHSVFGKDVRVESVGGDKYHRTIGRVWVDGKDVNLGLVRDGLAWHYARYDHREAFRNAERDARAARVGLWGDAHPVAPWDWRKMDKEHRQSARDTLSVE